MKLKKVIQLQNMMEYFSKIPISFIYPKSDQHIRETWEKLLLLTELEWKFPTICVFFYATNDIII